MVGPRSSATELKIEFKSPASFLTLRLLKDWSNNDAGTKWPDFVKIRRHIWFLHTRPLSSAADIPQNNLKTFRSAVQILENLTHFLESAVRPLLDTSIWSVSGARWKILRNLPASAALFGATEAELLCCIWTIGEWHVRNNEGCVSLHQNSSEVD